MMKKSFRTMLGVTLLEIMLVLAIAAMVVVMSIRYYQSATTNQKVASTLNNITAIVAAGENYLSSQGTYEKIGPADVTPYMPGNKMPSSGWGGEMGVENGSANGYDITVPSVPTGACKQLAALIKQNGKVTMDASCTKATVTAN
ncbi:MAG TPA: hypothetical protein VLJ15_08370 [Gammaproteobacteria bacterium]|nr:hypothetical protein [Gammaproteobacteria bacterium]